MAKDVMDILRDHYSERGGSEDVIEATAKIAELIAASPDMAALFRAKWGNLDPDANAVYERFVAALAACRGL